MRQAQLGQELIQSMAAPKYDAESGAGAPQCHEFEPIMSSLMQNPCTQEEHAFEQQKREVIKNTLAVLGKNAGYIEQMEILTSHAACRS